MTDITGFPDEQLASLTAELQRRALTEMDAQSPGYMRWLRKKLSGALGRADLFEVLEDMRKTPLPETIKRRVMWRDILTQALEVRTTLDDLAWSLHYLQNPPDCEGCDLLIQHEFEFAVLKYESLREHLRDFGEIVLRQLTDLPPKDREAIVAGLAGHSLESIRHTFAHTRVGIGGEDWLMIALSPREAGEPPLVGLPLDFDVHLPGLVSLASALAAEGERLIEQLITSIAGPSRTS